MADRQFRAHTAYGRLTVNRIEGPPCGCCGKIEREKGVTEICLPGHAHHLVEGIYGVALWDALEHVARTDF